MADRDDEEILRIILEKGSDKAKKAAADALAQQPPTPTDPSEVKPIKTRKRRKGLKNIAAKIGNSKYYYDPTGAIVDENGQPAPERIAKMLLKKDETANAIKGHLTKIKPNLAKTEKAITEKQQREVNNRIERLGKVTENTIATHNTMIARVPVAFNEFQNVLDNFAAQNNMIIDSLIRQNDEFQEKVMELLTGVKAPTKSSGETKSALAPKKATVGKKGKVTPAKRTSVPTTKRAAPAKKPRTSSRYQQRVAAMSDEQKAAQGQKVQERAERIGQIRTKRNIAMVAGGIGAGAVGGAAAVGIGYGAYKLFAGDKTETKSSGENIPKIPTENLDDGTKRSTGPTGAAGGSLLQQQPSASPPPAGGGDTAPPPGQQQQQQGGAGTPSKTPGMTTLKTPVLS